MAHLSVKWGVGVPGVGGCGACLHSGPDDVGRAAKHPDVVEAGVRQAWTHTDSD